MILRSVIKHVRDQNWVAVGLDFVIVVVGVFIGIQVSNWNEKRQMQAELDAALRNFAQEVSTTIGTRRAQIENESEVIEGLRLMSELLDDAELDDQETDKAYQSLLAGLPHPDIGRYETLYELQSSGRLKDITPSEIREHMGMTLSSDRLHHQSYYEAVVRRVTAPPFSPEILVLELPPPDLEDEPGGVAIKHLELERASNDPAFRNRIIQLHSAWKVKRRANRERQERDEEMLELLQSAGYWSEEQGAIGEPPVANAR